VHQRYAGWLAQQSQAGVTFSPAELWWLDKMVEVIAVSAGITPDDLDNAPFTERGGADGAIRDPRTLRGTPRQRDRALNHALT
jgi:Domain of unknown function (DUF3559).